MPYAHECEQKLVRFFTFSWFLTTETVYVLVEFSLVCLIKLCSDTAINMVAAVGFKPMPPNLSISTEKRCHFQSGTHLKPDRLSVLGNFFREGNQAFS